MLQHPRTHTLFKYLPYLDRQLLIGFILLSKDSEVVNLIEPELIKRPFLGPFMFYIMSNLEIIKDKFSTELTDLISDEDIGEYIEGVGSNQALYMVSELCISLEGGIQKIKGLDEFIDRVENHYLYF